VHAYTVTHTHMYIHAAHIYISEEVTLRYPKKETEKSSGNESYISYCGKTLL
jgi:hypothetical protein